MADLVLGLLGKVNWSEFAGALAASIPVLVLLHRKRIRRWATEAGRAAGRRQVAKHEVEMHGREAGEVHT